MGRDSDGEIVVRWSGLAPHERYEVFVSATPDEFDHAGGPQGEIRGRPGMRELRVPNLDPTRRYYFELVKERSESSRVVAERLLPLDGTHNFRDLGGYATRDGRRVRWGRLYRSDHLADLSDRDLSYLKRLGVALVCDFRSRAEREEDADRLPTGVRTEVLEIADDTLAPGRLHKRLLTGDLDDLDVPNLLVEANRHFATTFRDRYRRLFERLQQDSNLPLLIHCTAGKDRTGFGAALIRRALGVPQKTIFEDFLRSNVYSAHYIETALRFLHWASFFRTDPERVRPLLEVRRAYLEAAFAAIHDHYGSFDDYLRDELGVSDSQREALRARLLR